MNIKKIIREELQSLIKESQVDLFNIDYMANKTSESKATSVNHKLLSNKIYSQKEMADMGGKPSSFTWDAYDDSSCKK